MFQDKLWALGAMGGRAWGTDQAGHMEGRGALVNLTLSGTFLFPMETPLSVKLCTEHGDTESDSLCAALKLSFKQQLENPYNALPYP